MDQRQQPQYAPAMSVRTNLPPTPPMQSDSGFDGRQSSPSATSTSQYSAVSAPANYYFSPSSAINNMEPHYQRQHVPNPPRRVSMPYSQSSYAGSAYNMSPNTAPIPSYYSSPMQVTPPQQAMQGLYYQRPLPQVIILVGCLIYPIEF